MFPVYRNIILISEIKKPTSQLLLNIAGRNDYNFNFDSGKVICRHNSILQFDFLEAFHILKNLTNVVNCDFAFPHASDCWKTYIKSIFS